MFIKYISMFILTMNSNFIQTYTKMISSSLNCFNVSFYFKYLLIYPFNYDLSYSVMNLYLSIYSLNSRIVNCFNNITTSNSD
jgi:hypothetical protein